MSDYVADANSSPTVGDEIVSELTGNHYKVVDIDYTGCAIIAIGAGGERCILAFDGFKGGVYKKV